ncbi:hypothetical protein [Frankia sp. AiPs1]|nr:hypothetical protein [Frankia sp. AiPs1]
MLAQGDRVARLLLAKPVTPTPPSEPERLAPALAAALALVAA